MAIQKKQIVQTALDILDRDGLEGVTLRRLAQELNIKAASIYWHIENKEKLLDEMANVILEERFSALDFVDDGREWDAWLTTLAHELRAAMLARREGARVVAGAHPEVAMMLVKLWDLTVRVLHRAGFSYGLAATVTVTVMNFTFGSVIEEQASPPHGYTPLPDDKRPFHYPAVDAALDAWAAGDDSTRFATGVRILINGIRVELANQQAE